MTAFYDFFRQIVLQPNDVTLEADSVSDTLTITAANGVAFAGNALSDSFTIDVNYQLYVPLGSTSLRLQDVHSNSSEITITAGQNINVSRVSDNEIVISGIIGGISKNITNATQTNPVVITTSTNHDFTSAVFVTIEIVTGMTQLNNNSYYIDVLSPNTFALYTDGGLTTPLDGTGFSAYSGPSGTATAYFFTTGTYYTDTREAAIRADIEPVLATAVQPGDLFVGDLKGSVFGDDSTLLVDGDSSSIPWSVLSNKQITTSSSVSSSIVNEKGTFSLSLNFDDGSGISLGPIEYAVPFSNQQPYQVGNIVGDLKGSVFGDDSTLLVDGVNSRLSTSNLSQDGAADGQILTWSSGSNSWIPGAPNNFDGQFSSLTNVPTTVAGYGITDAYSYIDITNTNGLTTTYYLTFVDSLTTQQILRADVDLKYRTDTNTLTADTFEGNLVGDLKGSVFGDDSTLLVDGVNSLIPASVVQGTFYGNVVGDLKGSVFGDDSTLLVDGVNNLLYGTFVGQLDVVNPIITGEISSSDSSPIVFVPAVEMRSDLNVDNGIFIQDQPVATEQFVRDTLTSAALIDPEAPNTVLSITDILDDFLDVARAIWLVDDAQASQADNLYADGVAETALDDAKEYTDTQITNLIDGAPNDLNTLDKLAFAINYDPLFYQTVGSGSTLALFSVITEANSGSGDLSYDNTTGEFTYTPPDLSPYLTAVGDSSSGDISELSIGILSDVDIATAPPENGQALVWDGVYWVPGNVAAEGGGGSSTFIDLTDTPGTFSGNGNTFVKVNSGATALVFEPDPGYLLGSDSIDALNDVDTSTVAPQSGEGLVWNGTKWVPSVIPSLGSFSVTTNSASGGGSLSYDTGTGVFTFVPAETTGLSSFSVSTSSATGNGSLSYDNSTGEFTFTPPDLSDFVTSSNAIDLSSFSVSSGSASSGGSLSYDNSTGVFSFAPADLSETTTLSSFSITNLPASSGGSLSYDNSTGVFSYAAAELPDLGNFVFNASNITTDDSSEITITPQTRFSSDVITENEFKGSINWNYVFNTPKLLTGYGIQAGDPLLSSIALTASSDLTSAIETLTEQITTGDSNVTALIPTDLNQLNDEDGLLFDEANIDTDLLPEPTATHSIGSLTKRWLKIWTQELSIGQKSITVSGTAPNEIMDLPAGTTVGGDAIATTAGSLALTDFSVTTGSASSGGSLTYDNTTGVFSFAPADLSTFTTLASFSVSTASTPTGGGSLAYNNTTGVYTFTPAATIALTSLSVTQNTASGTGTLAYNNSTGVFTYTPPDLSSFATRSSFSVSTATASGGGSLAYNNSTGVFTFTPAAISSFVTTDTTQTITGAKTFSTNNLRMNDNIELEIGSGADMEIYHNGTDNYIDLTVGDLLIRDDGATGDPSRFSFARSTGNFIATGDVTAFGTISDIRQKENIIKIDNALEKVLQLNGYTFNYIGNNERLTGVIAQEVMKVLPEAVYTTKKLDSDEEIFAVRHGNMIGLLIETIKELSAKITDLEKRLS